MSGSQESAERTIEDIQKEIIEEARRLLSRDQCQTLVYPNERTSYVVEGDPPDYEHGSLIRFAMVQVPKKFGREEVCIALVDNKIK